ncbi:peptidase family C78-domain-containing protein [Entophlyctis helioformis]|nr:peptidase family C78-domain-containing protein [Entophlyctis helioformis]
MDQVPKSSAPKRQRTLSEGAWGISLGLRSSTSAPFASEMILNPGERNPGWIRVLARLLELQSGSRSSASSLRSRSTSSSASSPASHSRSPSSSSSSLALALAGQSGSSTLPRRSSAGSAVATSRHVVMFCNPSTRFHANGVGDNWSCGYRNTQMLCSALLNMPGYERLRSLLQDVPTVGQIQSALENAWQNGFDVDGAKQLRHKVRNTHKWIGTTEVAALMHNLGFRTKLYDVHAPTGPNGTHPQLVRVIREYFEHSLDPASVAASQDSGVQIYIQDTLAPIYLQHQGHSRTIVGFEVQPDGQTNLIVFDPGRSLPPRLASVANVAHLGGLGKVDATRADALLNHFRVPTDQLRRHGRYSMLWLRGGVFGSEDEQEAAKHLVSTRIP